MNVINWDKLLPNLIGYFKVQPDWNIALYLLVSNIFLVWLVSILFVNKFIPKYKYPVYVRKQLSFFYGLIIGFTVLIAFTVWFTYYDSFIYIHKLQSVILVISVIYILLIIILISKTIKDVKAKNLPFVGISPGPISLSNSILALIAFIRRQRIWFLIVYIPFLLVLFTPKEKYLYSFVFDNSGSMDQQNQNARDALGAIVDNLKENSHFMVTHVPFCGSEKDCAPFISRLKKDLKDIVKINKPGELVSSTLSFQNKSDFYNYLTSGNMVITGASSPIYECIWDNFINSFQYNQDNSFNVKRLIVLTDGMDNLYANQQGFTPPNNCIADYAYKNTTLSDFFNEITFISYTGTEQVGLFSSCSNYEVLNGQDFSSLSTAFSEQLEDIYFDRELLVLLLIFITLGLIILLNIK